MREQEEAMSIAPTLHRHLAGQGVAYESMSHPPTGSSSFTAETAHIPGSQIAKGVVLRDEGGWLLAVLPASHHLRLAWVEQAMGRRLELAGEQEASRLFPDCEIGAIPPLGDAYGQEVLVDEALIGVDPVLFEGGDHKTLVKITGADFARLMAGARRATISAHD
jgi:Ala-tRNA(Pro) deacylase